LHLWFAGSAPSVAKAAARDARSPEPKLAKSPEPKLAKSPEPKLAKSPEPKVDKSPEPKVAKSPEPKLAKSPEPKLAKSPEPKLAKSPEPKLDKSPEPVKKPTPSPAAAKVNAGRGLLADNKKAAAAPAGKVTRSPEAKVRGRAGFPQIVLAGIRASPVPLSSLAIQHDAQLLVSGAAQVSGMVLPMSICRTMQSHACCVPSSPPSPQGPPFSPPSLSLRAQSQRCAQLVVDTHADPECQQSSLSADETLTDSSAGMEHSLTDLHCVPDLHCHVHTRCLRLTQ
jgi:hypothetical protein